MRLEAKLTRPIDQSRFYKLRSERKLAVAHVRKTSGVPPGMPLGLFLLPRFPKHWPSFTTNPFSSKFFWEPKEQKQVVLDEK